MSNRQSVHGGTKSNRESTRVGVSDKADTNKRISIRDPEKAAQKSGGWPSERMSTTRQVVFNTLVASLQIIPQSMLFATFPTRNIIATYYEISDPTVLPWLVASYALPFGAFILVSGRLGDIFGHKTLIVLGLFLMSVWSVVAGFSHYGSFKVYLAARAFQGMSAALMVPNGLALLGRTYSPTSRHKTIAFALFGLWVPVGSYLGMLLGSIFGKLHIWWWFHYVVAVISAIFALLARVNLLPPSKSSSQSSSKTKNLGQMDWYGITFGISGLVLVYASLVSALTIGWNKPYLYFCLIIGLLLISFFVISEIKIAEHPLAPFRLLRPGVGFVLAAVSCGWASFGVWSWYLWRWLLVFKAYTPLTAVLHTLPIVPFALISTAAVTTLIRKYRPVTVLICALAAFTVACVLLAISSPSSTYWTFTFLSLSVMPLGMILSYSSATLILSNSFPLAQQGVAGSFIMTGVTYSQALALGIASAAGGRVNSATLPGLTGEHIGLYVGAGLGGLGLMVCLTFLIRSLMFGAPALRPTSMFISTKRASVRPRSTPAYRKSSRLETLVSSKQATVKDTPLLEEEKETENSRPTTARTMSMQSLGMKRPMTVYSMEPPVPSAPEPTTEPAPSTPNFARPTTTYTDDPTPSTPSFSQPTTTYVADPLPPTPVYSRPSTIYTTDPPVLPAMSRPVSTFTLSEHPPRTSSRPVSTFTVSSQQAPAEIYSPLSAPSAAHIPMPPVPPVPQDSQPPSAPRSRAGSIKFYEVENEFFFRYSDYNALNQWIGSLAPQLNALRDSQMSQMSQMSQIVVRGQQ